MCIIAIKPAGVAKPTAEQFKCMCDTNSNGFGYMTWSKEKGLQVYKTMDRDAYMKRVNKIPDDQPVVYHMRIATHGSVQKKNCHPFMDETKKWAFAHNGILSIHNEGDMTDSETFFKRIAMPFIYAGILPGDKAFDKMIDIIINSSKFVFMNSEGELFYYGHFIKDKGLLFSNDSYKPRVYTGYGGGLFRSGPYGGYSWFDDYYDDCRKPVTTPVTTVVAPPKEEPKKEPEDIVTHEMSDAEFDSLCDYLGDMMSPDEWHIPLTFEQISMRCAWKFKDITDLDEYINQALGLLELTYDEDKQPEYVQF